MECFIEKRLDGAFFYICFNNWLIGLQRMLQNWAQLHISIKKKEGLKWADEVPDGIKTYHPTCARFFSFSQIFVIFVIAHWSSELWSQCDRLTLVNIERRSSWRKDNVCFWSQSVKLHSPPKDWWTINSPERERERDDWRRRRNGAKYSWQLVLWQKWKTCGINWPIVNLPKESKIFLPGIYYFARDHFHCIARSSRRAAIRGMMEHTCWSLGIISPIFDNWIFDHLIWYLIWHTC